MHQHQFVMRLHAPQSNRSECLAAARTEISIRACRAASVRCAPWDLPRCTCWAGTPVRRQSSRWCICCAGPGTTMMEPGPSSTGPLCTHHCLSILCECRSAGRIEVSNGNASVWKQWVQRWAIYMSLPPHRTPPARCARQCRQRPAAFGRLPSQPPPLLSAPARPTKSDMWMIVEHTTQASDSGH